MILNSDIDRYCEKYASFAGSVVGNGMGNLCNVIDYVSKFVGNLM